MWGGELKVDSISLENVQETCARRHAVERGKVSKVSEKDDIQLYAIGKCQC